MSDNAVFLLTPLKEKGHNLKGAVLTDAGKWLPLSGTLGELGNALEVDPNATVDVVRSTPDPWSQASSFADAVLSPTKLTGHLVEQWRGLIALFALSARYESVYKLSLIPVPLINRSSRFAEVMRHLLPQTSVPAPPDDIGHGWDRPIVVRIEEIGTDRRPVGSGYNVGLLNPASLVAAGRDVERIRISSIPWMRDGLTDPSRLIGTAKLTAAELGMIARFAQTVHDRLAALCGTAGTGPQQETLGRLRSQLLNYATDCAEAVGSANSEALIASLEIGDTWAEGLPALYQPLAQPFKPKAPAPGTSQCMVRLRDDLGERPPFKGLVLLDAALASVERPANAISFWGDTTLQQVLSSAQQRESTREEIAKAGYLMVTPDDLFTEVLVRLDDEDRPGRVSRHAEGLRSCLLPLSPLALLVRKPEDLATKVSANRDGKVIFHLQVDGRDHPMARRYVAEPQPGEGRLIAHADWGLGDLAVWPDFRSQVWTHYLARIDYPINSINRLRGRFALSGALLADLLRATQSVEERARRAMSWGEGAPLDNQGNAAVLDRIAEYRNRKFSAGSLQRLRASNSGGKASEVQKSNMPFEAAFYTIVPSAERPATPAGMAILNIREIGNAHDREGRVAVDFGTTNTVACLNDEKPAVLMPRIVHPVEPQREGELARSAFELSQRFRDFFPPDLRDLPSPTAIISRPLDQEARAELDSDSALNDSVLIRHLMYFQPDFAEDGSIRSVPIKEWSSLLSNIKYNLKWSRSPEMRDAARRYLRQLMMMLACEWAANEGNPALLTWLFSRPRNMGDDPDFVAQLRSALADVVKSPAPDAIRTPIFHEGDAAAAYILDEGTKGSGTKGALNIILDIGGGTTDIAIWDNGAEPKRILSPSIRLAGGDFFTGHIVSNPEILEDFGLSAWSHVIRQLDQESDAELRNNLQYVGELLFSGKTLDRAIDREWSRVSDTDDVRRLKETAYVFLGGVAWYVGREIRNLIRDGVVNASALSDIAVAFCGRGSGLFARIHGTEAFAQTEISRLMLLIPAAAGEARPSFPQVQVSPVPKIEVAAGMIIASRNLAGQKPASAKTDATGGVDFSDLGVGGTSDSPIAEGPTDGKYTAMPLSVGIEDLDPFLAAFSRVSGFRVSIDAKQKAKLINEVADIDRNDQRDGRPPQSEFAAVIKALVHLIRRRPNDVIRPKTEWN